MGKNDNSEVVDRESFIRFVDSLIAELNNNPASWENNTLKDFIEALSSYTEDIDGYYQNTNQIVNADVPSWRLFADILRGATMYQ